MFFVLLTINTTIVHIFTILSCYFTYSQKQKSIGVLPRERVGNEQDHLLLSTYIRIVALKVLEHHD